MPKNTPELIENSPELLEAELEYMRESYADAVAALVAMENVGWKLYTSLEAEEGFGLQDLKQVSKQLREWTDTNPLLLQGWNLRCSYMFGMGYTIDSNGDSSKISKRLQDLFDKEENQDAVFSEEALKNNERSRYTDGAVFVTWDKAKQRFQRIPLRWIDDVVTDPDDVERKWFYRLVYDQRVINSDGQVETKPVRVWVPTDRAETSGSGAPHPSRIGDDPVDYNRVMIDDIVGEHTGNPWGTPDCFTAAPWALAYSSYLRNGDKVLASLAEWTWKVTPKSKKGGDSAAAKVKTGTGAVGGTIVTDMDVNSLPRGNAVDLTTGRPLASQVASCLGISVVLLLSDPGTSGAFATANTLTDPSLRSLYHRQKLNTKYLKRCLRIMGIKDPIIIWEKMNPDADYREMQTKIAALGTGLFHSDEARENIAKIANFKLTHDAPPEGYLLPNNANSWERADIDPKDGPAGSTVKTDGTTALTNGQGKDVSAKPSYGQNDLRGTGGRDN